MKIRIEYLLNALKHNQIYLIVLLMFILVFLYGKNIIIDEDNSKPTECIAVNDSNEIFSIDNQSTYFAVKNIFNSSEGDYYRLKFVAEVTPDIRRSVSNTNEKGPEYQYVNMDYPYKIETIINSQSGEQKKIGEISIEGMERKYYEYIFKTDGNYSDVVFRKFNVNDLEKVIISNVGISRLDISSDTQLGELTSTKQSIVMDSEIPELPNNNPMRHVSLSTGNQQVGQLFEASEDYLGGVYLSMNMVGNGGVGDYTLNLYMVSDENNINILAEPFRSFRFQTSDFDKFNLRGDLYKIPFFFPLEKGKKYYLSISNRSAVTNRSNNLSIGIWDSKDQNVLYYKGKDKNYLEESSALFPIFLNSQYYNGEKLTNNSLIEDLGGGKGRFHFSSLSQPSDLLVPEYNLYAGYDQYIKAVTFWGEKKYSLDYKFNTIYPIKRFRLNLKQAMGLYPKATVKFSLDGTTWQEIENQKDAAAPYLFSQTVEMSENKTTSEIYVSISPKDDPNDFANKYLAIYDFELGADLDMEKK
ncbi:MAG: hypothetical protein BWY19_00457 [bacterium ADurb.Bin212]|nr:MAG: hypothetical protein BWY19_00457 [bacterium ADurb.Bin212]